MIFPVNYIKDFFKSLEFPLIVKTIEVVDGNTLLKVRGKNTQYINVENKVDLDGKAYKVIDLQPGESFTLRGDVSLELTRKTYMLPPPYFFHGLYRDAKKELADRLTHDDPEKQRIMPSVYLLEPLDSLKQVSDPRSSFEWDGSVRMFLINQTDWTNLTNEYYEKNLIGLGAVIDAIRNQYRKYFKVDGSPELIHKTLPKFINRTAASSGEKNKVASDNTDENAFSQYLSAIELTMRCPIVKCKC